MLIKVSKHIVLTIPELLRSVLKLIYEPEKMSLAEEELMQKSFIAWSKNVALTEYEAYALGRMAMMLEKHSRNGYANRKGLFKEHKIDYRKFHKLPEVAPSVAEYKHQFKTNMEKDAEILREIG